MTALQNYIDGYGFGISKKKLIENAYRQLEVDGHRCCIINNLYIEVDGKEYQIIKSIKQNRWIAKEF